MSNQGKAYVLTDAAADAAARAARVESRQAQEEKLVQLFEAAEGGREP